MSDDVIDFAKAKEARAERRAAIPQPKARPRRVYWDAERDRVVYDMGWPVANWPLPFPITIIYKAEDAQRFIEELIHALSARRRREKKWPEPGETWRNVRSGKSVVYIASENGTKKAGAVKGHYVVVRHLRTGRRTRILARTFYAHYRYVLPLMLPPPDDGGAPPPRAPLPPPPRGTAA